MQLFGFPGFEHTVLDPASHSPTLWSCSQQGCSRSLHSPACIVLGLVLTYVQHPALGLLNLMRFPFSLPVWQNTNWENGWKIREDSGSNHSYFSEGSACQLKCAPGLGALAPCVSEHSIMKGLFFILYIRTSQEKRKETSENCFSDQTPKFYSQELKLPLYLWIYCNIAILKVSLLEKI